MGRKQTFRNYWGFCPTCKRDMVGVEIDEGIGPYEYWGAHCFHSDIRIVCIECQTELEEYYLYEEIYP